MGKMGDIAIHQTSFGGGILSANLAGRVDLAKYDAGLSNLENFIIHPEGGISNRTGTLHICDLENEKHKLIPFVFNYEQNYIIVLTHKRVRFLAFNGTEWGFVSTQGGTIYEIESSIGSSFFNSLEYVQSHDVVMITAQGMPPVKLCRYDHDNWKLVNFNFSNVFPAVQGLQSSFIGTGLSADEITVKYYVAAIDDNGDIGRISDAHIVKIKALWPQGACVKLTWNKLKNANGYNVYKSIEDRGLGYIGRSTGTTFIDDYITPDYTRSPDRKAVSIIYSKFKTHNPNVNCTLELEPRTLPQYNNIHLVKMDSKEQRTSTQCASFVLKTKHSNVFILKFNKRVNIHGITLYGSSDKKLLYALGSNFRIDFYIENSPPTGLWYQIGQEGKDMERLNVKFQNSDYCTLNIGESLKIKMSCEAPTSNAMMYLSSIMAEYDVLPDDPESEKNGFIDGEYPENVVLHNQRLIFSNTKSHPVGIFASRTGLLYDFTTGDPIRDDDAIEAKLSALRNDQIQSMVSLEDLFLFTKNGEFVLMGGNNSAISPTNLLIKQISNYGSSTLQPIVIGHDILFVTRDGRNVRVLRFNDNGFANSSLNVLCKHIFEGKQIVSWCYAAEPDSMVWCVLDDGTIATLTYLADQEIWAWGKHFTDGKVLQILSLPAQEKDMVFMHIERNGVKIIERLTHRDEGVFHDCAFRTSSQQPIKSYTLPRHFAGKHVTILSDSNDVFECDVDTLGNIQLPCLLEKFSVGLPYQCTLETLRTESRNMESLQGRKKRIIAIDLLLEKTRGNIELMALRDFLENSTQKSVTKTHIANSLNILTQDIGGYLREFLKSDWSIDGKIRITHKDPLPFTLLGLIKHVEVER